MFNFVDWDCSSIGVGYAFAVDLEVLWAVIEV